MHPPRPQTTGHGARDLYSISRGAPHGEGACNGSFPLPGLSFSLCRTTGLQGGGVGVPPSSRHLGFSTLSV